MDNLNFFVPFFKSNQLILMPSNIHQCFDQKNLYMLLYIYFLIALSDLVPYEPEMVALANGDVISRRTWPCWGMDVKCGKGTDISYGPWADRQR